MKLSSAMARWPYLEVAAKWANAYAPIPSSIRHFFVGRVARSRNAGQSDGGAERPSASSRQALEAFLTAGGLKDSDVLLVHSGNTVAAALNMSLPGVISCLRSFVGERGTIVMPTIPALRGEPQGRDRFRDEAYSSVLEFDRRRSAASTGFLPRQLLQTAGARRGINPFNNLTALGPHANFIFSGELETERPTPCGPGSAWEKLESLDPFILAINCNFARSVTMIHRVEEAQPDGWVIPERRWYRIRKVRLKDYESAPVIDFRERKASWSIFFAEHSLQRRLIDEGVVSFWSFGGLSLTGCRASALLSWARVQNGGFPYILPRWLQ